MACVINLWPQLLRSEIHHCVEASPPTNYSQPVSEHTVSQPREKSEPFRERGPRDEKHGGTGKLRVAKINGDVGHDGIIPYSLMGWAKLSVVIVAPFLRLIWICHRRSNGENNWELRELHASFCKPVLNLVKANGGAAACQEHAELWRPCLYRVFNKHLLYIYYVTNTAKCWNDASG